MFPLSLCKQICKNASLGPINLGRVNRNGIRRVETGIWPRKLNILMKTK
jgi:hypothetical protein